MDINALTIGDIRTIQKMFGSTTENSGLNAQIGEYVIVRTQVAGNFFGILEAKSGKEIYLKNARRMWEWWAAEGISLSSVALYGIKHERSRITAPVAREWLEAIEIISMTDIAINSLLECPNASQD